MGMAKQPVVTNRAGNPAGQPAHNDISETVLRGDRIDFEKIQRRPFEPLRLQFVHHENFVVAVEGDHSVDHIGIKHKEDQLLRLLPGAVAAVDDLERLARRTDVVRVEFLFQIARRRFASTCPSCAATDPPVSKMT